MSPNSHQSAVQPSEGLTRQGSGLIGTFGQSEDGDRTPKQKVKLKVTEEKLLNLMLKYNGGRPRSEKGSIKVPKSNGEGQEERPVEALMVLKYGGVLGGSR
ncbi:hypothetical protein HRI_004074500 [Hibiscus trionum]|uniref:Uncharacterized protein n=1 Tax=Hibiscus trionum TaxID=183268 RepID=A0A9W7IWU7_HIBTR|nr:hypothetical protein HRI_004074500 [Hibiscus trionum]